MLAAAELSAAHIATPDLVSSFGVDDVEWAVIVTMVAMRMMEPTADKIVDVVAVRNRLVSATGTMDMAGFVAFVAILGRASDRVLSRHFNDVLIDAVPFWVVQMSVMQVVDVVAMPHCEVTAFRAMMMRMVGLGEMVMGSHGIFSFRSIVV